MVDKKSGRIVGEGGAHVLHRLFLLLVARIRSEAKAGKKIETGLLGDIALEGAEHGGFVRDFTDAGFAERESHMCDGTPDEHCNASKKSSEKITIHICL